MFMKFLFALLVLLLPALAEAADVSGVPKISEGDQIQIGNSRIRLGGIDAPSVDQLCLNNAGERWPCAVPTRHGLITPKDTKARIHHPRKVVDHRVRTVAR